MLDVGTETGVAARQFPSAGCTVLGVEPDARMAEFARRSGVEAELATFEAWEPARRAFDSLIAGTAFLRDFGKQTSTTVDAFLATIRLMTAADLLSNRDLTVASIAAKVG